MLIYELRHDKTNKISVPSEDSDQPGHPPSLIRVFAVCWKGSKGPKLSSCGQRRLVWLGGCPGWSESSLSAHSLCWFCHVAAHIAINIKWLEMSDKYWGTKITTFDINIWYWHTISNFTLALDQLCLFVNHLTNLKLYYCNSPIILSLVYRVGYHENKSTVVYRSILCMYRDTYHSTIYCVFLE